MAFGWVKRDREQSMDKTKPGTRGEGGVEKAKPGPFIFTGGKTMVMLQCDGCYVKYEVEVHDDHKDPDERKMEVTILKEAQDNPRGKTGEMDLGSPYRCQTCGGMCHLFRIQKPRAHDKETI